jgi:hypothetical protein
VLQHEKVGGEQQSGGRIGYRGIDARGKDGHPIRVELNPDQRIALQQLLRGAMAVGDVDGLPAPSVSSRTNRSSNRQAYPGYPFIFLE